MILPASTSNDLLALEARRTRAMVDGDVETLDSLLLDGCRYVHSNGLIDSKETYLEKLRSGTARYLRMEASEQTRSTLGRDVGGHVAPELRCPERWDDPRAVRPCGGRLAPHGRRCSARFLPGHHTAPAA